MNDEKIACHVCQKEIPKAAAVHSEGEEYVHHFCSTECMNVWKKKKEGQDTGNESCPT
jgi:YHS domain-containing protein